MSSHSSKPASPHPLDPLTVGEVQTVSSILQKHLGCATSEIKFKVIDLAEPPKAITLQHLYHNGSAPDRKARVYYHLNKTQDLLIAIINVTTNRVEKQYAAPDSQGPVDWDEFELVNKACNDHPAVQAEIAKLKLPPK